MSDELKTNLDEAARFLLWAHPRGPWVLTSIPVEGGRTTTETFFDIGAARGWIDQKSGKENVYWTVNRVRGSMDSKPKKEHIEEAVMLHVDLDPRKGEDVASEQARIIKLLNDFSPSPSAVVYSGGGYQGFWRLDEPLYVGGDPNRIADLEAYNRQLGIVLLGDNTWNIDRIMRLPGTINLPDKKKRDKGRVTALASIVELSDAAHPLADFTPAAEVQSSSGGSGVKVQISGNLPRLKDLDELPEAVTQRTRMLIVQGDDPDDPTKYGSRSEVMWAVTCELIRAGCEDDMIAAVLLDPDFGVSDHPLRQKRSVEYVARQIERAREEVSEPMLARLNADHAVIEMYGGKCRVVSWRSSEIDPSRQELVHQSFEDFRNRYMNIRVQTGTTKEGNPVYSPAGKWWLENPMRRQYRSIVFRPDANGEDGNEYNIWRGLAVKPAPGPWPLLRQLIEEVLAAGDFAGADYILRWAAYAVQYPERQAEVALALLGGKGTGKSTFGHIMRRIFGQHGTSIASSNSMTNNFNKPLHDCCLLFADEAVARGDAKAEGIVKSLITEPTIMIEPKGVDAFPATNRVKVIIASNDDWVVSASADERRFAVFNVSPHLAAPPGSPVDDERVQWWKALNAEINGGGLEAFLHDLLALDLGDWHPRYSVPQNDGLIGQKAASLRGLERVWYDILSAGTPPIGAGAIRLGDDSYVLPTEGMQRYCTNLARRFDVSPNAIADLFGTGRKVRNGCIPRRGMGFDKRDHPRPRGWIVPTLGEARRRWDVARWPGEWDASDNWAFDEEERPTGDGSRLWGDDPY
ncbi:primase-helicase family protein [Sphingomonas sp. M1A8_2b]